MASDVADGFYIAQFGVKENSKSADSIELHERFDTLICAQLHLAKKPPQSFRPWFLLEMKDGKRTTHRPMYRQCHDCGSVVPLD